MFSFCEKRKFLWDKILRIPKPQLVAVLYESTLIFIMMLSSLGTTVLFVGIGFLNFKYLQAKWASSSIAGDSGAGAGL